MNKKKIFQTKILFLYDFLCDSKIDELTKLFYIKNKKTKFENRKLYIQQYWLKKEISPTRFKTEYVRYPFYKLAIDGRRLFKDADDFIDTTEDEFKKRIKDYRSYKIEAKVEIDIQYRYIYLFSKNIRDGSEHIDFYTIEYLEEESTSEIEIKVLPPTNRKFTMEAYFGTYKEEKQKVIINIDNPSNHIHAIFNTDISEKDINYLVGIIVGIADSNEKNPIAKKAILSKEKFQEIDKLYLILNEVEQILANEHTFSLTYFNNRNYAYLKKFFKSLSYYTELFKRLSNNGFYNGFYHQLGFNGLYRTNKIFTKIKNSGSFFVHSREDILKTLINTYQVEKFSHLFMVMPTYKSDNIFEHFSQKAQNIQNAFIELGNQISINIIFVLQDCKESLSIEFLDMVERLSKNMTIQFISKTSIEQDVNSIDFIFTDKHNFLVTKYLRQENPPFYIHKDKHTIIEHENSFYRIEKKAIGYKKFVENHCVMD